MYMYMYVCVVSHPSLEPPTSPLRHGCTGPWLGQPIQSSLSILSVLCIIYDILKYRNYHVS